MQNHSVNQWQKRPLRNAPIICQIRDRTEAICLPFLDALAEGVVVHHTPIRRIQWSAGQVLSALDFSMSRTHVVSWTTLEA